MDMASTVSSSASTPTLEFNGQVGSRLKAKSTDVGWEYAEKVDPLNADKLKCLLCNKTVSGGIYWIKQHIANIKGNVIGCNRSSDEDKAKCLKAIEDARNKKKQRDSTGKEVVMEEDEVEMKDDEITRKQRKFLGPMDRYISNTNPESSVERSKKSEQLAKSLLRERKHEVDRLVARWVYETGVPFRTIESDSFKKMVEAIGQFGPGFKFPPQFGREVFVSDEDVEKDVDYDFDSEVFEDYGDEELV